MTGPYGTAHGELYLFREAGLLTARSDLPTSLIWVIMTRTIIICEEHHLFVWNLWRMKLDLYATMSFAYGLCNLLDYHQNCLKGIKKMSRGFFLSHLWPAVFYALQPTRPPAVEESWSSRPRGTGWTLRAERCLSFREQWPSRPLEPADAMDYGSMTMS